MREKAIDPSRHYGRLAFMSLVSAYLLACVLDHATTGWTGLPGVVVHSFAVGFGLEFVCAGWTGRAPSVRRRPPVHH